MNADDKSTEQHRLKGKVCVHCLRRCGTSAGGYATIAGQALCSRPTVPDRPDCYRLVTAESHQLHDCAQCLDPAVDKHWPQPARLVFPKLRSLN